MNFAIATHSLVSSWRPNPQHYVGLRRGCSGCSSYRLMVVLMRLPVEATNQKLKELSVSRLARLVLGRTLSKMNPFSQSSNIIYKNLA